MKKLLSLLIIACVLLQTLVSCTGTPNDTTDSSAGNSEVIVPPNEDGIILNELMPSNKNTLTDNYGDSCDWIELYNNSDKDISLLNYMLTDKPTKPEEFVFPDITLKAGEYLVVYASGRNETDAVNKIVHLPFKINYVSEVICLFSADGVEIGRITVNDVPADISCGPDVTGKTVIFSEPTPGAKNVTSVYVPTTPDIPLNTGGKDVNTLYITEYATNDTATFTDEDGEFGSWAEIYNHGTADVKLFGLFLSDNPENPEKWAFPDVTLKAGEYTVVFMSGKTKEYTDGSELHATFGLSGDEQTLSIYNGKAEEIDTVPVHKLVSNLTFGRTDGDATTFKFFPKATPKAPNTVTGFDSIESARYPENKSLFINEIVAVNRTLDTAPDGKTHSVGQLYDYYELYDYIEICNLHNGTVTLSDYYIGDSKDFKTAVQLPEIELGHGEYRIVYFGDETYYSTKTDSVYVHAGLNRYGETVYIFDENGICVDSVKYTTLFDGTSAGRANGRDDTVYYYEDTTPGKANSNNKLKPSVAVPTFENAGGYMTSGSSCVINVPKDCTVYYTTDGSLPTTLSTPYTSPIPLTKTVTVRAAAYRDGYLHSEDVSASYVVGRQHTIPVVCLSTEHGNLFSDTYGILVDGSRYDESAAFPYKYSGANYWEDWERPIRFDYIDEGGQQVLSFNAGIKVFGQYSRAKDQKSVSIYLRDKYGPKEVSYPFFGNDYVNVFSSLALRSSGQDGKYAHLRDAYCAELVRNVIDVDIMAYKPVAVYINGEYFGLYDLRERINEDYIAHHTGADPDNVDLIKGGNYKDTSYNILEGTIDEYKKLVDFLKNNSLKSDSNYKKACEMVDVDELINYWICVIFFSNTDSGNIKYYKENTEGAKWRWILYDLDWGMFPSTYLEYNMFSEVLNPEGHGVGNSFSTLVLRSFMSNATFKDKFLTTFGEYLNSVFMPENMLGLYEKMVAEIKDEMPYQIERWNYQENADKLSAPYSYASWEKNVDRLRNIIADKRTQTIDHMIEHFRLSDSEQKKYLGEVFD